MTNNYNIGTATTFNSNPIHEMMIEPPIPNSPQYQSLKQKHNLVIEYNQQLINHGFGLSKTQIRSKNIINLIPICEYEKDNNPNSKTVMPIIDKLSINPEFCERLGWLSLIPCFTEGVLRINIGRYIHWIIKDINLETQTITLFLQDYLHDAGQCGSLWSIGISGTVTINANYRKDKPGGYTLVKATTILEQNEYENLYQKIPYKTLNWSTEKIKLWESIVLSNAKEQGQKLRDKNTTGVNELTKLFCHFITLSNQTLDQHKPKAKRQSKSNKKQSIVLTPLDAPIKKITRTVGAITIESKDVPKQATGERITHYKLATWERRGTTRKLKSGKYVPVKPTTIHRKCLKRTDVAPQTELKFKP